MRPEDLDSFRLNLGSGSENALAFILALMIFAVALGLRAEHFRFFREAPRLYFSGVFAQIIGLPLLTLLICFVIRPVPSVALGMILVACCPGGNVSNLLALYGRANTALSVSLTATSSVAAAFITPFSILFWSSLYPPTRNLLTEINLDAGSFLTQTMVILALPLLLGMLLAKLTPTLSARLQKPLATLSGLGLAAIIIMTCIRYAPDYMALGFGFVFLIGLAIAHNGLAFALGYASAVFARADIPSRRSLTLEVGIQNSGLGIVILLTQLDGLGGAGAIAGAWGTWHIIAGLILVGIYRRQDRRGAHV